MARIIINKDNGPTEIKVGDESKWVCMCGLSNNKPFCDGSHKKTKDEEEKLYVYNKEGSRVEL